MLIRGLHLIRMLKAYRPGYSSFPIHLTDGSRLQQQPCFRGSVRISGCSHVQHECNFLTRRPHIDLAHSLINELPTPLDSSVLLDTAAAYFSRDLYCNDGFERMDAALKCLILLIDVCRLCFKPTLQQPLSVSTAPSSLQTDERTWARLINKLLDWYKNRPASLKPFMETEGSRTKPPTMLFTHNGAVWANMIYHVSMLIMTLHKPTGISFQIDPDLAETQESQLSSPWHTQRILATSCASDRRWWDPCMIAAFYFAEKHSNLSRHYM